MLTYAGVVRSYPTHMLHLYSGILTYADLCLRMLTSSVAVLPTCCTCIQVGRMLTDAGVCWRMLTHAGVCWRMLTEGMHAALALRERRGGQGERGKARVAQVLSLLALLVQKVRTLTAEEVSASAAAPLVILSLLALLYLLY
jgi:hypothetical protein